MSEPAALGAAHIRAHYVNTVLRELGRGNYDYGLNKSPLDFIKRLNGLAFALPRDVERAIGRKFDEFYPFLERISPGDRSWGYEVCAKLSFVGGQTLVTTPLEEMKEQRLFLTRSLGQRWGVDLSEDLPVLIDQLRNAVLKLQIRDSNIRTYSTLSRLIGDTALDLESNFSAEIDLLDETRMATDLVKLTENIIFKEAALACYREAKNFAKKDKVVSAGDEAEMVAHWRELQSELVDMIHIGFVENTRSNEGIGI